MPGKAREGGAVRSSGGTISPCRSSEAQTSSDVNILGISYNKVIPCICQLSQGFHQQREKEPQEAPPSCPGGPWGQVAPWSGGPRSRQTSAHATPALQQGLGACSARRSSPAFSLATPFALLPVFRHFINILFPNSPNVISYRTTIQ